MVVIPNTIWSIPISDFRARMQVTTVGEVIPVNRSESFIGHVLWGRNSNFDVSLLVTEHGVLVESDLDFGMRSIGAVGFATVSEILDGDDVAPTIRSIA